MSDHSDGAGHGRPPAPSTSELDAALTSLREQLSEALGRFEASVEAEVYRPRRELFGRVAEAHARAWAKVDEVEAPDDAADKPPPGRWEVYAAYRNAVLNEVLVPLRDRLHADNAAEDLERAWGALKADLLRLSSGLPAEVQRLEPADFFRPSESDSFGTRVGKVLIRTRRRGASGARALGALFRRLAGGKPEEPPPHTLAVPLRRVAEGFLLGPLIHGLAGPRRDLHRHCASSLAGLERGVAHWTKGWPPTEIEVEGRAGYLSGPLRAALGQILEELGDGGPADMTLEDAAPGEPVAVPTAVPVAAPVAAPVAEALAETLALGAESALPPSLMEGLTAQLEEAWSRFAGEVAVAGTFMGSSIPPGPDPASLRPASADAGGIGEAWTRWHRAVPNRLVLSIHHLRMREGIVQARDRLVAGVAEGVVLPLSEARRASCNAFQDLARKAQDSFSDTTGPDGRRLLAERVDGVLEEALHILDREWSGCLGPDGTERKTRSLADEVSSSVVGAIATLPVSVVVQDLHEPGEEPSPFRGSRETVVREAARRALDVLRLEKLRLAPASVLEAIAATREEMVGLPETVRFNLEAAKASLTAEDEADAAPEAGEDVTPEQAAASLTVEGLSRAEESLSRLLQTLPDAWWALVDEADQLLGDAYLEVHGMLTAEGGVDNQLMGFQARFRRWVQVARMDARTAWSRAHRWTQKATRRLVVRARKAVRFGKTVVAGEAAQTGERDRALAMLREAPEVLAGLPLIYRRLFSFEPLAEPGLLKGRETEEAWVRSRYEKWQGGMAGPTLLTGPVGAGHTSFFNVLSSSLFADTRLVRMELTERVRSEDRLAALLSEAFGIPSDPSLGFDDLEGKIREAASDGRPWVLLVERVEQLFLRTPGGTDLFEDFLSFQAQTADDVFWLSSMSGAAWKLVAKTEPRAASLIQTLPLTPPSREGLEALIMVRHRRSGLPLEFLPPKDPNPLVRRRLRRARTPEARQEVLRTEYFDRLFRLSQDSIPLAILYWLRSTDFRSGEGTLFVTSPSEIRYAFLDDLDLELDFALKAFMEHGSLTLAEYQEVFAAEHEVSVQTFEVLRARLLLEPVGGGKGLLSNAERRVDPGVGYRIPSLLSQVVARRLKDRNILH